MNSRDARFCVPTGSRNVGKGIQGRRIERVSVCKESLLTVSTVEKFATVQKKKSDGVGHIQTAVKMIVKTNKQ